MNNKSIQIQFDPSTAIQVREAKANAYGFDLTDENYVVYVSGQIQFTIIGFRPSDRIEHLSAMIKVQMHPHINDEYTYTDRLDFYNTDKLNSYARTASAQLKTNAVDEVRKALYSLKERLEKYKRDKLKNSDTKTKGKPVTANEQSKALDILSVDNLTDCIKGLLQQAGIASETDKALTVFIALLTRHFENPLHILLQGSELIATLLIDIITATIPASQIRTQTSMSGKSIYHTPNKKHFSNTVLSLGIINKDFKAGAILQELIKNKTIKRYTTQSDYHSKQLYATTKIVEGPVCLFGYTSDEKLYDKYFQESLYIRIEKNKSNTEQMHRYKQDSYAGITDTQGQNESRRLLMTIQSFIKPVHVVVPYATEIPLPKTLDPLQSYDQLLTFIQAVALLHQYKQKPKHDSNGTPYIEATAEHLQIAIELFNGILTSQNDILTPAQRSFLERLKTQVKTNVPFKISEVMNKMQMKKSYFYKEFNALREQGYITKINGNKKDGVNYQITEVMKYEDLIQSTDTLEAQLIKIKPAEKKQVSTKFPRQKRKAETPIITSNTS